MYSYRKDGISVLTVIDRRRRKNNRVQKYYPTGQDVTQDEGNSLLVNWTYQVIVNLEGIIIFA